VCKAPEAGFKVLSIISGFDPKDGAMIMDAEHLKNEKWKIENGDLTRLRVGAPKHVTGPDAGAVFSGGSVIGFETVEFELKYSDVYTQIMQILCCAELSNNISRYDGIKFGYRAKGYGSLHELYTKSRTEAFGADVKLAAIVGAMVLSQENYMRYYDKAMRLRRLIRDSLDFDKYDLIAMPKYEESDGGTVCAPQCTLSRLCGLPSITTPECTFIANAGCEGVLEAVCKGIVGDAI